MANADKGTKITVDLGSRELYRALRFAAVEEDRSVREIVIEALEYWLVHRENLEDARALEAARRMAARAQEELAQWAETRTAPDREDRP
jgi:hypothetical protein